MKIFFTKYQGTGNDFVMLDNRSHAYSGLSAEQVRFLCDRRFGIGADGLILLEKETGYDFTMVYYNSDGRTSSMCGNGGRCITAFAHDLNLVNGQSHFHAVDGDHDAVITDKKNMTVKLRMSDVPQLEKTGEDYFLNTGSPHFVRFVKAVKEADLLTEARKIRYAERFLPGGTNVNFVQVDAGNRLTVRSYERGVEDETLSCGTGVTASVLAAAAAGKLDKGTGMCEVTSMGGPLKVFYTAAGEGFTGIWLEGNARFVYSGEIEI